MAKIGDTLSGKDGKTYTLKEELGMGGEGTVYQTDDAALVAKVFEHPTPKLEKKILCMLKEKVILQAPDGLPMITWPQDILYGNGSFAGYVMPCVSGGAPIWRLARKDRHDVFQDGKYDWSKGLGVAMNLASVVAYLHFRGIVIGDMNSNNIKVHPNGYVTVIDTDSFDIRDRETGEHFKCTVGRPEFLAPELQRRRSLADEESTFTIQSDDFALAVHIFQILFGSHPFNRVDGKVEMLDRKSGSREENRQVGAIVEGKCPFVRPDEEQYIQPGVPRLSMLPDDLQKDFRNTFDYDALNSLQRREMRTRAEVWYQDLGRLYREKGGELVPCSKDEEHYHLRGRECELCRAQESLKEWYGRQQGWEVESQGVQMDPDNFVMPWDAKWYFRYKVNSSPFSMSRQLSVRYHYPGGGCSEAVLPSKYKTGDLVMVEVSLPLEQQQEGSYRVELLDDRQNTVAWDSVRVVEPKGPEQKTMVKSPRKSLYFSLAALAACVLLLVYSAFQYGELSDRYERKSDRYDEMSDQYDEMSEAYESMSAEYESMSAEYGSMSAEYESMLAENNNLLGDYQRLKDFYGQDVMVKVDKIYNAAKGGKEIPGGLKEKNMRYLQVDYEVIFCTENAEDPKKLYIDIYRPDGGLNRNPSTSPAGHTMAASASEGSVISTGWGNSDESSYSSGQYVIEFVYDGQVVGCARCEIK